MTRTTVYYKRNNVIDFVATYTSCISINNYLKCFRSVNVCGGPVEIDGKNNEISIQENHRFKQKYSGLDNPTRNSMRTFCGLYKSSLVLHSYCEIFLPIIGNK